MRLKKNIEWKKKHMLKLDVEKKGCVEAVNQNTIQNAPFIFHIIVIFTIHISFDSFVFFNLKKSFTYHSKRNKEEERDSGNSSINGKTFVQCNTEQIEWNDISLSDFEMHEKKKTENINILISCCVFDG